MTGKRIQIFNKYIYFCCYCCCLLAKLCGTLCHIMGYSPPGSSAQFSSSVMSNCLWPHGLQHTRLPCPSSTPGACSNSCSLSHWCHPTTSSSVIPFSCLQSFPASGYFSVSQCFASGGQSIGASASASVLQWIFGTDYL